MRGVDLGVFDFDYDLTWAGFFLNGAETVLGRYGGRDGANAEKHLSLPGLKNAMRAALVKHRAAPGAKSEPRNLDIRTAERYPAASRLKKGACIHCHQVWDFRRSLLQSTGKWTRADIFVYPSPAALGIELDVDDGSLIRMIAAESLAASAGLRAGDRLLTLGDESVASFADAQHALHRAPEVGVISFAARRDGADVEGRIDLPDGWREWDISWRESMWGLDPQAWVYGIGLSLVEKDELGLGPKRLAFVQSNFVWPPARKAGIRAGDVILGYDGKELEMNMRQFNAHVRLNQKVGDRIVFDVVRDGKRMKIPMTLARQHGN